jgi:hypothetical protein
VGALQGTWLGTMYATANGQTGVSLKPAAAAGGGANIIGICNAYNRIKVTAMSRDSSAAWTYATNTWRQADNNANNRISFLDPLGQINTKAQYSVMAGLATAADGWQVGVLFNTTSGTPNVIDQHNASNTTLTNQEQSTNSQESFLPAQGFNFIQAMENAPNAVTCTFNTGGNTQRLTVDLEY